MTEWIKAEWIMTGWTGAGWIAAGILLLLAGGLAVRLYLLKRSLREAAEELREIRKDLTQNQAVHQPVPDRDLELLLGEVNNSLSEIRRDRNRYEEREHIFQSQIEAVSHDLRTPLTVILGYLRILQRAEEKKEKTERAEILDTVIRKAHSMEKLTEQFYEYSRLTAGDLEPESERIDAGKILREVLADNCIILEKAGLQVYPELSAHPVWAWGDKEALERILVNLIQNAARYAHTFVRIAVKEAEEPGNAGDGCGKVKIIFENDTQRLSKSDIPHLFQRFYMNDSSRNQGGTGLGLTIARALAEEMGGSLRAEAGTEEENGGEEDRHMTVRFVFEMKKF